MTKLTRDDGTKLYVEAGAVECAYRAALAAYVRGEGR